MARDDARRDRIRRLLDRREREGLTFRELAERSGIPAGTLGSWAWKLRQEAAAQEDTGFVELVEAEDVPTPARASFEIVLEHGRRILVRAPFDESALARLVALLERC